MPFVPRRLNDSRITSISFRLLSLEFLERQRHTFRVELVV